MLQFYTSAQCILAQYYTPVLYASRTAVKIARLQLKYRQRIASNIHPKFADGRFLVCL